MAEKWKDLRMMLANSEIRRKWLLYAAQLLLILVAVVGLALCRRVFGDPRAGGDALFNIGVDVTGSFVCAALFFGCLSVETKELGTADDYFVVLILLNGLAFFLNECSWLCRSVPAFQHWDLAARLLGRGADLGLVYFFWRFVRLALGPDERLTRWSRRGVRFLLLPLLALLLVNFLVPDFFRTDAQGVVRTTAAYRLSDLYPAFVAVLTLIALFRSRAAARRKALILLFGAIPVAHYILTLGRPGYATQYGAALAAITLMRSALFFFRSRKLFSTQTELQTAAQLQEAVLPGSYPAFPDRGEFDIYAKMDPAREVGGDFYDHFLLDDDHLCLIMADVSGKGVPAALIMLAAKIILVNCARQGGSPEEILTRANDAIYPNIPEEMFVTVWLGVLEISTGRLVSVNAGHEYPALRHARGRFKLLDEAEHGFVLGGMEGTRYEEYVLTLKPGDKLFLYTDGVPEASDRSEEMFGGERMLEALNADPGAAPEELLKNVRKAVDDFVGDAEQFDDLTMLCLEYRGPADAGGK